MTLWTTVRSDDELGSWRMWIRPVGPGLAPYASRLTGYDQDRRTGGTHLTPANLTIPLVVPLTGLHRIHSPGRPPLEVSSFLAGIVAGAGSVQAEAFHGLQVDLSPVGAFRLTRGDLGSLAGRAVALDDVVGGAAGLTERLGNTDDWETRFEVLEGFLTAAIRSGPAPAPEVAEAWRTIVASGGAISVSEVASQVGWSPRHLRSRVHQQLGVPPKVLARLSRFHRASELLEGSQWGDLGRVAHAAGYYDQAHFGNEIRALSGRTPLQHLNARKTA